LAGGLNRLGQFALDQFHHPPRGRAAGLIQPIPIPPAAPPEPFLDDPGIEQLAVEV